MLHKSTRRGGLTHGADTTSGHTWRSTVRTISKSVVGTDYREVEDKFLNSGGIKLNETQVLNSSLDMMLAASDASDFCRRVVHSDLSGEGTQGAHIYLLDNSSHLQPVAGYGSAVPLGAENISIWDENPLARCIREKRMTFEPSGSDSDAPVLLNLPWIKEGTPIGCLTLVMRSGTKTAPFSEEMAPALGKIGAMYVSQLGLNAGGIKGSSAVNPDDLTTRQITILTLMADGLVNGEIARELMLSESTIRQETVRIYRALGVGNRQEASRKGRALGLIQRIPRA